MHGVWKKINVRNQAYKQSSFLIIRTFSIQPPEEKHRIHNFQGDLSSAVGAGADLLIIDLFMANLLTD